jgi:hypothetical protein
MSNVLLHRFISPHTDGADLTQVQPSNWNDGHRFTGGAEGDVLTRTLADASFGATWQPAPAWVDVPFNAANFQVNAGGTWSVAGAGVFVQAYLITGRVIDLLLKIEGSTITGAPTSLLVAGWGPVTLHAASTAFALCSGAVGGWGPVPVSVTPPTNLTLNRSDFGAFPAGTFYLYLTARFRIV